MGNVSLSTFLLLSFFQTLLEQGGDPRLIADDGTNASQVTNISATVHVSSVCFL